MAAAAATGRCACRKSRDVQDAGTQTDTTLQGQVPRLSTGNLFTLLSLWMERFPKDELKDNLKEDNQAVRASGLVVVRDGRVSGLYCSGPQLHAAQAAIVQQAGGGGLAGCQLYFSRRPCATCLKMVINADVSQIFFWPGDPEVSMLLPPMDPDPRQTSSPGLSEEAQLDAAAVDKLKASRSPACVPLPPLFPGVAQYVDETSRVGDFVERVREDEPEVDTNELFSRQRRGHLREFAAEFLIVSERQHRHVLTHMGLENLCVEPYLSGLRHNMRELVEVLATVSAGVPLLHHGFYSLEDAPADSVDEAPGGPRSPALSQEVARHCIIQARLLAYRTEDPKVGVGAVIWAEGQSDGCDGTGRLYLVGCGYNAYPVGSQYAQYPQMDTKYLDRQWSKYRYIIHAEQNALTFRSREMRAGQRNILFVTKCPCDECVPLIRAAGITHVYTTDQDCGKDKGDISYLRFRDMKGLSKFTVSSTHA
ncbi:unnamed protein product [Merluccius merluccius]